MRWPGASRGRHAAPATVGDYWLPPPRANLSGAALDPPADHGIEPTYLNRQQTQLVREWLHAILTRLGLPHRADRTALHAPGRCPACDEHPDWQALRILWGVPFTGDRHG